MSIGVTFKHIFTTTRPSHVISFDNRRCRSHSCIPQDHVEGARSTGWPDWANCRQLGDCLLWAAFL
jgi:hypothetical protein